MKYIGHKLEADLESIWKAARVHLPAMATSYATANLAVNRTSRLFEIRPSAFYPKWRELRDEFQHILYRSADNLEDTATALRTAVTAYAETDAEARQALTAIQERLGTGEPDIPDPALPYDVNHPGAQPPPSSSTDGTNSYGGAAPTVGDLQAKAAEADQRYFEARVHELGLIMGGIAMILGPAQVQAMSPGYRTFASMTADIAHTDVATYQPAIDALAGIGTTVADGKPFDVLRTETENVKDALDEDRWLSPAAEAFRENFLNAYEDSAAAQVAVLGILRGALEGYQKSLEEVYVKTAEALDAVIAAFKEITTFVLGWKSAKEAVDVTVKALEASAAFAASVGGGGICSIVFALIEAKASIDGDTWEVGGSEADKAAETAKTALAGLAEKLSSFDALLSGKLAQDTATVVRERHRYPIELPRPNFADAPGSL
ncbi:hypothetical protein Afil01_31360 [Actinorhabdospora filicis]|uniref:Uncharacterized protein n=1 Tax=Actinorhabdospora filicis TaxID=1785913 RepID=A0A9W6SJS2_9ACTN|nr:hypothetical protein [Actinorhabdospora filicis]GLZ78329.1 hypothetical protein Afil01_31360 [Actinorhabdospora filicis]